MVNAVVVLAASPLVFDITTPEWKLSPRKKMCCFFSLVLHVFLHVGHVSLSSPEWPGSRDLAGCHSEFPSTGKRPYKEEAKLK